MKNKILIILLLALSVITSSLSAQEYDLRANMVKLNSELNDLQRAFMTSNKKAVEVSLDRLAKDADDLLGNKDKMIESLPKDMKNRKHKVNIAVQSARAIKVNVKTIRQAIADKDKSSILKRQAKAQEAYTNILNACFQCHNLVRDKGRIIE
jgi:hypothetical protein